MTIEVNIQAAELTAAIMDLADAIRQGGATAPVPATVETAAPAAEPEKPKRGKKKAAEAPQAAEPVQITPAPEAPAESPAEAPAPAGPVPSMEAIANAGAKLLDDDPGKMPALLDLLGEFNVQAITYLHEDQLAAFADRLRALGAEV